MLARFATLIGLLLYTAFAIHVTWPWVLDPADYVLGGIGDQTGGIAHMREWIESGLIPVIPGTVEDFGAPEGLDLAWGVNLSGWPWTMAVWLMALVVGPIAAFGLSSLLGLILSGVVMQRLALRMTGSAEAALVAGFAFAFYPYAVMKAATHITFAHGWPLALMVLCIVRVWDAPTTRNVVVASLASILAVAFTPYYILIGGVLLGVCLVTGVVIARTRGDVRRRVISMGVIGAAVVAYLGVISYLTLGSGGNSLRAHSTDALYTYAARAHEYVVPFGRNILVGDLTAPYLQERIHGSNFSESQLYLGLTVLALALLGGVFVLLRRAGPGLRLTYLFGLAVAAVAFVFSAPPKIQVLGLTIPMPGEYIGQVTTTWRVYSRFVVDVMLGVALMAAVGIAAISRGRSAWTGAAITALAIGAIAIDFTWRPGAAKIEYPRVYELLKDRPDGLVAQYPLLPAGFGDSADLLYQDAHDHRLLNGYAETGFEDRRASTLYNVNELRTARGLASLGVRYIMVPDVPVAGTPDPGRPVRSGFRRLGTGAYGGITATVYEVAAEPDLGYAYVRTGGSPEEGPPGARYTWLLEPRSELTVDAPRCRGACSGILRMRLQSFARTREVTLRLIDGKVIWRGRVGRSRVVQIPLRVDDRARIELTSTPGPVTPNSVDPANPDVRPLSIGVSGLRFTAARK